MSRDIAAQPFDEGGAARTPAWARAPGERGRGFWRKPAEEERPTSRRVGYVVSIIVNAILIGIARSIPTWGFSFVTPTFGDVLPAIELSLVVGILVNAVLVAYDEPWFRHLMQVVVNGFSLYATLVLRRIFPFEFGSEFGNDLARLAITLTVIALIIAIVVEAVQAFLALFGHDQ